MSYLIDIIGSTAIAAAIIFIVLEFNKNVNDVTAEVLLSNMSNNDALTSADVIEYDLYKIGYGVANNAITRADSNYLSFLSDFDNNGSIDSVSYIVGTISQRINTANPYDKPLYRKVNNGSRSLLIPVVDGTFTYLDSIGTTLNYASLASQAVRNRIKVINVNLRTESAEPVNNVYQGIDWARTIRPKNL